MRKIAFYLLYLSIVYISFGEVILDYSDEEIKNALSRQYNLLNINEKKLLNKTFIILYKPENATINTVQIDGVVISNVVISNKLVPKAKDRFFISHYIRNIMIEGNKVYNKVSGTFINAKLYIFNNYNKYIKENTELICKVIYCFYHKDFYDISKNYHEANILLRDEELGEAIKQLKHKLKNEDSYFQYEIE